MREWNGWPWLAGICAVTVGVVIWVQPVSTPPPTVDEMAVFARPRVALDALPAVVTEGLTVEVVVTTSRLAGRYRDVELYVVEQVDGVLPCLVVYPVRHPDAWSMGCGDALAGGVSNDAAGVTARMDPAGAAPDGWVAIDENVSVSAVP